MEQRFGGRYSVDYNLSGVSVIKSRSCRKVHIKKSRWSDEKRTQG